MNNLTGRLEKESAFYQKMDVKLKNMPSIINEYYISLRANRKSYTSIKVYINNILHFIKFLYKDVCVEDFYKTINTSDVERYFISLETKKTASGIKRMGDDVLQQRWSSLNRFFEFLLKRNYIDSNPISSVDRPKNQSEHKITYLTKTEINKLLKAVDKNPIKVMAIRDSAIIKLALATGLRVSALTNINIEDIDFDNNIINVIEKGQKVREISIGENIKQILKEWLQLRSQEFGCLDTPSLFVSQKKRRISEDRVAEMLAKYCNEAGIKKITPHKLRASAACALAKHNIPVKAIAKQLGHNNITTTMRYIDVFYEDSERAKGVLDNLF